ncbi:MAG: ribonuclease P protein component 1 [Candidatus Altarchaeaceae archaeon]
MRTIYNILRHEIIGLYVKVVKASCLGYLKSGKIIDETKNMIVIETDEKEIKKLPKRDIVLQMTLDDSSIVEISGKLLIGRPEERIKKKYKIFFSF